MLDNCGVSGVGGSVALVTPWLKVVGPPIPGILVLVRSLNVTVWFVDTETDPT
jgi:hypothetical protein